MSVKKEVSHDHSNLIAAAKGVGAAFFYALCSLTSGIVSKAVLDTMKFDFPTIIMVTQMMLTITVLETLSFFKVINLPQYTIKRGMSFAGPAFFYGVNAILALSALSHMNIAMYGVLKRCVPVSTMLLSWAILNKGLPSKQTIFFVVTLTVGCVMAGYGDLGFNLIAYICGVGSNFTHATYLILVQKHSEQHMSSVETLQLNSYNTLPLLLFASIINGELFRVHEYAYFSNYSFIVLFLMSITNGMMLNYSLFLCTSLTSALTTSVTGGVKAIVQTLIGFVAFGGISNNVSTYFGISLNLFGGVGYIWTKYQENQAKSGLSLKKVMSLSSLEKQNQSIDGKESSVLKPQSNGLNNIHTHLSHTDEK